MKILIAVLTMAMASVTMADEPNAPIRGLSPIPFPAEAAPEYRDDGQVRVLIDPKIRDSTVQRNFSFTLDVENFSYEPSSSTELPAQYANGERRANAGHFHVYAALRSDSFNDTNVFLGAPGFVTGEDGKLTATIDFPCDGRWLIFVVTQYDDHTPRIPQHPQQWPGIDTVEVTVTDQSPVVVKPLSKIYALLGRLWGLR